MKAALKTLLNSLDAIARTHGELRDTEVCEALADEVGNGFIDPVAEYTLPTSFGMFTPVADSLVHAAMSEFLSATTAATAHLSARDRLDAFQDPLVKSTGGHNYREYFGHVDDAIYKESLRARERNEYFGFKPRKPRAS